MKYVLELSDQDGKACRVRLEMPLAASKSRPDNSIWRSLDEGFLKFRSGGCGVYRINGTGFFETEGWSIGALGALYLYVGNDPSLLKVDVFTDHFGNVNSSGEGEIKQECVGSFRPGKIVWTRLE